tara:strand:+ start:16 stop:2007 length:1992 start_codon:yes stop_codon:yes gene_type:complete
MLGKQLTQAAAGSAAGEGLYVDDLFSTYLYEGNGSSQTITHGIDITGEGGLTWIKRRTGTSDFNLFDTERGFSSTQSNMLNSNQFSPQLSMSSYVNATTNGFVLNHSGNDTNDSSSNYVSWNFRKAPGFFDVVTYVGTGSNQNISHNLGSVPGVIIVKNLDINAHWTVYHRELGSGKYLLLNDPDAEAADTTGVYWGNTAPTSSVFTVGSTGRTNGLDDDGNGHNYVAYIFAHDDQSFGDNGNEAIIKCGSYTGTSSSGFPGNKITLGFEPQWLLIKNIDNNAGDWEILDSMRGMFADLTNGSPYLRANRNYQENTDNSRAVFLHADGFSVQGSDYGINGSSGNDFVYIAIRRPHKQPEAATDVFTPQATRAATDGTPSELGFTAGFPVDLLLYTARSGGSNSHPVLDRIRGGKNLLATASDAAEASSDHRFDSNEGIFSDSSWTATNSYGGLLFRRAPGFFDIVVYNGTGSTKTESHNLGVVPEMMWIKRRDSSQSWSVYYGDNTDYLMLDSNAASIDNHELWNDTSPTASVFTVGPDNAVNSNNDTFMAYLFASLDGISKVGSYTGTGSNIDVNCNFTAGARFVLIKRTDGWPNIQSDWYVWDTARGIVAGDDPWIALNLTQAEVTYNDFIDPYTSGFTVTSTAPAGLNASGGTYTFLAIA